jgi:hypothetical protein
VVFLVNNLVVFLVNNLTVLQVDILVSSNLLVNLVLLPLAFLKIHSRGKDKNSSIMDSITDNKIMYLRKMSHNMNNSYLYKHPMRLDKPTRIETVN